MSGPAGWCNTTRAEVCECGCDTDLHDVAGNDVTCPNCGVWCGYLDPDQV